MSGVLISSVKHRLKCSFGHSQDIVVHFSFPARFLIFQMIFPDIEEVESIKDPPEISQALTTKIQQIPTGGHSPGFPIFDG